MFERESFGAYLISRFPDVKLSWHHLEIIRDLMAVERGECKRLILNAPPRHSKSLLVSEHFPPWVIGRDPTRQVISASYSGDLSLGFGRRVKEQMISEEFGEIFPECCIVDDSRSSHRLDTTKRGRYIATSVGGTVTGRGGDVLIIDDPVKDRQKAESETARKHVWDWYRSVARTRLQPGGSIIVMQTRWHEEDLTGKILKHNPGEWRVRNFPAINDAGEALWPEYFDLEALQAIKHDLGSYEWEALYQGNPSPREGGYIPVNDIRRYDELPEMSCIIQSADTATKEKTLNDFSVISTWGKSVTGGIYLIDCYRKRVEYPRLKAAFKTQFELRKPSIILVEDASSGVQVIQELHRSLPIKAITPKGDKVSRASPFAAGCEAGLVYFPNAPWVEDLISELRAFPNGAHDDFVDTCSMGYNWLFFKSMSSKAKNPLW